MIRFILVTVVSSLLASCATPPTVPLYNAKGVNLDGFKFLEVQKSTGLVDGSMYTGAYTKIYKFHYDVPKQNQFISILESEISSAGGVKSSVNGCRILVDFMNTYYESNSTHYNFNVSLEVACNDKDFKYLYTLDSRNLETSKEKWMHGPLNRRNRIEQKLLELILDDLQKTVDNA